MNAKAINHEDAAMDLMAEKYLLGELTESEREAYEDHLFSCQSCFEQVKAGTELVSHLRQIGTEASPQVPGFVSRFMANISQPVTATVFALLICVSTVSVYQHRTINGLRQPQVAPSFFLSDGARAGGIKTVAVSPNVRFNLTIQLLNPGNFNSYEGRILTESGQLKSSVPFSVEQAKDTIHFSLDSGVIKPGTYRLVINGLAADGQKTEITQYSFQVESKD
jgi:Putative zinc-finger